MTTEKLIERTINRIWGDEGENPYYLSTEMIRKDLTELLQKVAKEQREDYIAKIKEYKKGIKYMSDDIGLHSDTSRKVCDRIVTYLKDYEKINAPSPLDKEEA